VEDHTRRRARLAEKHGLRSWRESDEPGRMIESREGERPTCVRFFSPIAMSIFFVRSGIPIAERWSVTLKNGPFGLSASPGEGAGLGGLNAPVREEARAPRMLRAIAGLGMATDVSGGGMVRG
jgi:hypothetical protein